MFTREGWGHEPGLIFPYIVAITAGEAQEWGRMLHLPFLDRECRDDAYGCRGRQPSSSLWCASLEIVL